MQSSIRQVAILGSTGSIGQNTLEVVRSSCGKLRVAGLVAHKNVEILLKQVEEFSPDWVVTTDQEAGQTLRERLNGNRAKVYTSTSAVVELVQQPSIDVVVSAIVGSAGLAGTYAAIEAGKTIALANKETLVMAGPLVMAKAKQTGSAILPVDSEHSAVFQAMMAGRGTELKRIILTASGGPFRTYSREQMESVSVQDALSHPTWQMGPKITIDSATMMNKALEIIEARWLFGLEAEMIEAVVHPQSVVHSLVEFIDGSVIAQLSPPDMKLPIQYALSYPDRWPGPARKLDLTQTLRLDFEPPDEVRFPALRLGREVAKRGGTAGAVLNAANEAAVAHFLAGRLRFSQITAACERILEKHDFNSAPTLEQLHQLDQWARSEVNTWIGC